jgi:hypothetical protein
LRIIGPKSQAPKAMAFLFSLDIQIIKPRMPAYLGRAGVFLVVSCLIIFLACGGSVNISKADREKFIKTYVDLAINKASFDPAGGGFNSAIEDVFARNNNSKEFMNSIWEKMSASPKLQESIYREIVNRLKTIESLPPDSLEKLTQSIISTI